MMRLQSSCQICLHRKHWVRWTAKRSLRWPEYQMVFHCSPPSHRMEPMRFGTSRDTANRAAAWVVIHVCSQFVLTVFLDPNKLPNPSIIGCSVLFSACNLMWLIIYVICNYSVQSYSSIFMWSPSRQRAIQASQSSLIHSEVWSQDAMQLSSWGQDQAKHGRDECGNASL